MFLYKFIFFAKLLHFLKSSTKISKTNYRLTFLNICSTLYPWRYEITFYNVSIGLTNVGIH